VALLVALPRFSLVAASLEQAGYLTVASTDLAPLMESPTAVTVDANGNVYVLGRAETAPSGAQRIGVGGAGDLVVTKVSPAGQIIYNTVIGGGSDDIGQAIQVDSSGHVVIAGLTFSTNFPLRNAVQLAPGNGQSWFACRLAPDGASLVYSTYYGTGWDDVFGGMAVSPNGEAILAGSTRSTHFPVTSNAVQKALGLNPSTLSTDAVMVRLGANGSNVIFSTYLGGMSGEEAVGVALDATGATWVVGATGSPDFPVTPDAAQPFPRVGDGQGFNSDVFFAKLADDGSLLYSSFWGTEGYEGVTALSFSPDGNMLLAWYDNPQFVVARQVRGPGDAPFQPPLPPSNPQRDAWVTVLNPQTGQVFSQGRLAGFANYWIRNVVSDSQGNVHVMGDLPNGSYLAEFNRAQSRFVRFAAADDCVFSALNGLVRGSANALITTTLKWDTEPIELLLRKLVPSAPPPTNHPPVVRLGSYGQPVPRAPGDPGPFTITPVALDVDGTIQHVQFFSGDTLLATIADPPYTFAWPNPPYGEHIVRAVATDNAGLSATSCPTVLNFAAPPDNDSFYRSKIVSGASFTVTGTTAGATPDPQESSLSPLSMQSDRWLNSPSVWWCWRAPYSGTFSATILSNWFHNVSVFTGRDFNHLTLLGGGASVAFRANAGTAYYIRVSGGFTAEYVLSLAPVTPPPNDNFADRAFINGAPLSLQADNFNATLEPALPGGDDFASLWWRWTAPGDGVYAFSLVSTNTLAFRVGQSSTVYWPGSTNRLVMRATAGQEFDIRVGDGPAQFELRVDHLSAPANDNFADAIVLAGLPVSTSGSLLGATTETDEPYHAYGPAQSSVWYKWTASETTRVVLEVSSDNRGAVVAIYTGSGLDDLVLQTRTYGGDGAAQVLATAGTEYWIAVDTEWSGTGDFTLTLRSPNYPPNDDFDERSEISEGAYGSNAEATIEPIDEPQNGETESIWYKWLAPATGDFTVVIHSYGFYGRAAVYTLGQFDELIPVAQHTNSGSGFLRFAAAADTEYQIGFISQQGNGGAFLFRIRLSNAPVNDHFHDATPLSGASVVIEASNIDASLEAGEPTHFGQVSSSVWWTWTAPASGKFVVSIPRSTSSAEITVYRGTQLPSLIPVVPTYSLQGSVLFEAVGGEEYRIAAYNRNNQQGSFTLTITPISPPANDDFDDAMPLYGSSVSATGTTLGATAETGETTPSVWWAWTAPASGQTSVKITLARPLEVFTGASLSTLSRITVSSNQFSPSPATFNAQAGVTYHIRVSQQAFSPFTLSLKGPEPLPRPLLSAMSRNLDGGIQFSFDARIGITNVIETSTDLQTWEAISTNLTDCFPYSFTAPTSDAHGFYRARLVE